MPVNLDLELEVVVRPHFADMESEAPDDVVEEGDGIAAVTTASRTLTPDRVTTFGESRRQKVEGTDIQPRKNYLSTFISRSALETKESRSLATKPAWLP